MSLLEKFLICACLPIQDRFADARARPPVDSQQDWNLVAGREENGWTIVSFNRALQTGDTRDRDIVQVSMQLCTCILL